MLKCLRKLTKLQSFTDGGHDVAQRFEDVKMKLHDQNKKNKSAKRMLKQASHSLLAHHREHIPRCTHTTLEMNSLQKICS